VNILHTAVPPLANGASQPSVFNIARNARLMGHSPMIFEELLIEVAEHLTKIGRLENLPLGAPVEYDQAQYTHQVPGGVISNLKFQLVELKLENRVEDVLAEAVEVRKDLGYPIMITPHSQFVVTQAALNVATGERYRVVTDEVIQFALGLYGEDSGYVWMSENVKDKVLARPRAKELAEKRTAENSLQKLRANLGGPGISDEEFLLRYIMKGQAEVETMRMAGAPRQYSCVNSSLATLLRQLAKYESIRNIAVAGAGRTINLRKG
jgi:oxaloacetate decarboxylase alpha subunit